MNEKEYLRDLAKKYLSYANLDEMKDKEELWYKHNHFQTHESPVIVEIDTFLQDILPDLKCESLYGKEMEKYFLFYIKNYELVNDDKVIPKEYRVPLQISFKLFNLDIKETRSEEDSVGYHTESPIKNIKEDVRKLEPSTFCYDEKETKNHYDFAKEVLGDIMPIVYENQSLRWELMPTKHLVDLMGMQDLFMAMYDSPEAVHELLQKIVDDLYRFCKWQDEKQLLTANTGNHYAGSGSYGFLKSKEKANKDLKLIDLWGNINSQESVGVSPEMYAEFFEPYYKQIATWFGYIYYGCCEPVEVAWDSIKKYDHLRKISISPWCNEEIMSEKLAGKAIIYSRKPSPSFIGVKKEFDSDEFRKYIHKTVSLTKDCYVEYIFRDIYTLHGNIEKLKQAVKIVREESKI